MEMEAILVMWLKPFEQTLLPNPMEAPDKNFAPIRQGDFKENMF